MHIPTPLRCVAGAQPRCSDQKRAQFGGDNGVAPPGRSGSSSSSSNSSSHEAATPVIRRAHVCVRHSGANIAKTVCACVRLFYKSTAGSDKQYHLHCICAGPHRLVFPLGLAELKHIYGVSYAACGTIYLLYLMRSRCELMQ